MMRTMLTARIRKLKAKLRAVQRKKALKSEEEESVRVFRKLGWLGGLAGIVVLGSLTYLIIRKAK